MFKNQLLSLDKKMQNKRTHNYPVLVLIFPLVIIALTLSGCAGERYMLDDPVNDPIMIADDQQDSDLVRVEFLFHLMNRIISP